MGPAAGPRNESLSIIEAIWVVSNTVMLLAVISSTGLIIITDK